MLHQVGVSFDLYYDARKHKIKIQSNRVGVYQLQKSYIFFCEQHQTKHPNRKGPIEFLLDKKKSLRPLLDRLIRQAHFGEGMGMANLGLETRSTKINRSSSDQLFFVSFYGKV